MTRLPTLPTALRLRRPLVEGGLQALPEDHNKSAPSGTTFWGNLIGVAIFSYPFDIDELLIAQSLYFSRQRQHIDVHSPAVPPRSP